MAKGTRIRIEPDPYTELSVEELLDEDKSYRNHERYLEWMAQLQISQDQLDECPKITPVLSRAGGKAKWVEYLQWSETPEARKLLKMIAAMGREAWRYLPIEAFCLAVGIPTKKVFALIAAELKDQSDQEGLLVAAANHGKIVQALTDRASEPTGSADRKMFLQHTGFLPQPKNNVVHLHSNLSIDASQKAVNVVLPSVESGIRNLSDRFNSEILQVEGVVEGVLEGDPDESDESEDED